MEKIQIICRPGNFFCVLAPGDGGIMSDILVTGATSAIAKAWLRLNSHSENRFFLVGRNEEKLADLEKDLIARGSGGAGHFCMDFRNETEYDEMLRAFLEKHQGVDTLFIAHGMLGDQAGCEVDYSKSLEVIHVNFLSTVCLISRLIPLFIRQRAGRLIVISSVAGDRGRGSNFIYGSAKGALSLYLEGLGQRLHTYGIRILTVKPGFVDTPMTAAFRKGPLWAKPEKIALGIQKALKKNRPAAYLPGFWAPIMFLIRHIPDRLYRKIQKL
jgi:short-subunit dehydrogenase